MNPEAVIEEWFARNGRTPFDFQRDVWAAWSRHQTGLVHATTGAGKTLAIWCAWLQHRMADPDTRSKNATPRVIWVTPLKSLARDIVRALQDSSRELGLDISIEERTSDVSYSIRRRQREMPPEVLITTPESVSIWLSYEGNHAQFGHVELVVVDEWHELLGNKRGSLFELALARMRFLNPELKTWGLSATLSNLQEAGDCLAGWDVRSQTPRPHVVIQGDQALRIEVDYLLPERVERFPWAGHLGAAMVPEVVAELREVRSALFFTNTRSQAEHWYRMLLEHDPDLAGTIALHHGSIDRKQRRWIENALKTGKVRCVVCTSSLDLGVDFSPVDRVFQLGSPKGIARFLQRAGRSGHEPGKTSRITGVPTHLLQIWEYLATRSAIEKGLIEPRRVLEKPYDVLVQHLVTLACGAGFKDPEIREEIGSAYSFRDLTEKEWEWALQFVEHGGRALNAYPAYRKVQRVRSRYPEIDGRYTISNDELRLRHRMMIGTITDNSTVQVEFMNGRKIGLVDEVFVSRLRKGDTFMLSGRELELVQFRDMKAKVRTGKSRKPVVPRWMGGHMPLSTHLADALREIMQEMHDPAGPDRRILQPIVELQENWSLIPKKDQFLIEVTKTREGHHAYFFSFAGRLANEGLASLVAWRLHVDTGVDFHVAFNDYGFEIFSKTEWILQPDRIEWLLSTESMQHDLQQCVNHTEIAKRHFREIARISGLVFTGYPGRPNRTKNVQASAAMIFDVLREFDPGTLLLEQAQKESLERLVEFNRMTSVMLALRESEIVVVETPGVSPLAFPIYVDRLGHRIGTEKLADRVRRIIAERN